MAAKKRSLKKRKARTPAQRKVIRRTGAKALRRRKKEITTANIERLRGFLAKNRGFGHRLSKKERTSIEGTIRVLEIIQRRRKKDV